MAMNGYEEVASVKFVEGTNTTKVYHFALYDRVVEVGDYALVKSNNGYGSGNYGVVKVVGIEPTAEYVGTAPTAEILCKVDLAAYEKRCEMRSNRTALKKKMDKMVKDSQELLVYQTIANTNPEMAELLAAYRETLSA